jgi:hypothetical protein
MPDSRGAFRGQGWSRKREEGWQRVFGTEMQAHDHDWDAEARGLANLAETILDDAYADFLRRRRVS